MYSLSCRYIYTRMLEADLEKFMEAASFAKKPYMGPGVFWVVQYDFPFLPKAWMIMRPHVNFTDPEYKLAREGFQQKVAPKYRNQFDGNAVRTWNAGNLRVFVRSCAGLRSSVLETDPTPSQPRKRVPLVCLRVAPGALYCAGARR